MRATMPRLRPAPLLLLACAAASQVLGAELADEQQAPKPAYRETKPNKFVSVNVACTKSTLMVVASMNDPFYGLVYARGFPLSCRTNSDGQRRVKLKVNVEDCGVKVVEDEHERTHYEMMVYIQYDRHVQQAIDEQVLVRCDPDERIVVKASMGQPRADTQTEVTDPPAPRFKTARNSDAQQYPNPFEDSYVDLPEASTGEMTSDGSNFAAIYPAFLEEEKEMAEEKRKDHQTKETARCWMDILKGEGLRGSAFFEHLDVGDATTMLIKTRLNAAAGASAMDVMVTNCSAHDGNMARSQQLIDDNGCTIDPVIMSAIREHAQHGPGHRLHYSTFNAFKFPDRTSLHLRCTVLVCRGQCPRRHCAPRRPARAARIGHGLIRPVSDAELRSVGAYPIDRLLETLQVEIKDGSTIVDRIEVFNSAEVRAPGIESVPTRLRSRQPEERSDRPASRDSFFSDDRLLCMTSSRLLLSFGVLMAILIVSILMALIMCIKHRQQARKLRTMQTFQRIATPAPTPHYYRVGPM